MGWVSSWLRRRARQERPDRKVRPTLLELETRVVPAGIASDFINHGGPVLDHAQVEVIFYGQGWNSPSAQAEMSQIDTFMQYLAGSPFMTTMAQYGVSPATVTDSVVIPDALGNTVTDQQIQNALTQDIANGTLKPAGPERLYFVFTAPDVSVSLGGPGPVNFLGYHSSLLDGQNNQDAYAVIPYPGGPNPQATGLDQFQSLTEVSSHELAEAVTDPYVDAQGNPSGWDDYNFTPGNIGEGEIADIPNALGAPTAFLNGYAVTELWSNQADADVAPPGTTTPTGTLTVTAQNVGNAVAGQPVTATVATVSDTFANVTATDLTATINWGDGTTPDTNVPVTIDGNGKLVVVGTHTYANAGRFTISVTVTDSANNATGSDTSTATVSSPGNTGGTGNLAVTGQNVTAQTDQPFFVTVATVTDPGADPRALVATIDWGDGSQPIMVRVHPTATPGTFSVDGWHVYGSPGSYTITVTVMDRAGGDQATATAMATVTGTGTLEVDGQNVEATAGQSFTGPVAVVQDPGAAAGTLTATIDWGDGTAPDTNVPVTMDSNGNLVVVGTHTYASAGNYRTTITVSDASGNTVTDHGFADVDPAVTTPTTLPVRGVDVAATAGQSFTDVIAVVYAPGTPPGSLSVTVNWGDGTTDSNVQLIPYGPDGRLIIAGTHTYTGAGQDTIAVTVKDTATGATGTATATATVTAAASAPTTTTPTPTATPPTPVSDPPVDVPPTTITVLTPQGRRGHHGHHHGRQLHAARRHG